MIMKVALMDSTGMRSILHQVHEKNTHNLPGEIIAPKSLGENTSELTL